MIIYDAFHMSVAVLCVLTTLLNGFKFAAVLHLHTANAMSLLGGKMPFLHWKIVIVSSHWFYFVDSDVTALALADGSV